MTTQNIKSDADRDLWLLSCHEGAHALANIVFKPSETVSAKIGYSPSSNSFFGACCSNSTTSEIKYLVIVACGREGEHYRYRLRPLPEHVVDADHSRAMNEQAHTETLSTMWPTDPARFEKMVCSHESDEAILAKGIATLYSDYREVKRWPRTHRRIRARARLLLRQNLEQLHRIASELYYTRNFVYQPRASV